MNEPAITIVARDATELEAAILRVSVNLLRNRFVALRLAVDQRVVAKAIETIPAPPGYDPQFYHAWSMGLNAGVMAAVEGWLSVSVIKTYDEPLGLRRTVEDEG